MIYSDDLEDQQQPLTDDDLSQLQGTQAGDPGNGEDGYSPYYMDMVDRTQGLGDVPYGSLEYRIRPKTQAFLNHLSGIGTRAYLNMLQSDPPQYEDWRDGNFIADGSGSYLSPDGQPYTGDELEGIHGVLSRQAGNPLVSRMFDGPKSQLANYMTWRNQNFANHTGGGWEDDDGNLYTEPALQKMFEAKFASDSSESNAGNAVQPAQMPPEGNRGHELMDNRQARAESYRLFGKSAYGNARTEYSMWVTSDDGQYGFIPWPWSAEDSKERWKGPPPPGAVAVIHTHPNGTSEKPSQGDQDLADGKQAKDVRMPVYVLHKNGIWKAVPGVKNPIQIRDYRWINEFKP